jgi:hypothetical protein
VTAPEGLRHRLRRLSTKELVAVAARFRPGRGFKDVEATTKFALRSLARCYRALSEEIAELDAQLDRLVAEAAPELVSLAAIGTGHRHKPRRDALDRGRGQSREVKKRGFFRKPLRSLACRSLLG